MSRKTEMVRTAVALAVTIISVIGMTGIAGADLQLVDGFEDDDLSVDIAGFTGWDGDTESYSVINSSTSTPISGDHSLESTDLPALDNHQDLWIRYGQPIQPNQFSVTFELDNRGNEDSAVFRIFIGKKEAYSNTIIKLVCSGSTNTAIVDPEKCEGPGINDFHINTNEHYTFNVTNIDYDSDTASYEIIHENGTVIRSASNITVGDFDFQELRIRVTRGGNGDDYEVRFDDIKIDTPTRYPVSGTVTNQNGKPVENANITVDGPNSDTSTKTDFDGEYEITLLDGDYTFYASKGGYTNKSKSVTVSGSPVTGVDFTIREESFALRLDVDPWMGYRSRQIYTVEFFNTSKGRFIDVTADNVTSNDNDTVTVIEGNTTLIATNNRSVNKRVTITANYSSGGTTYVTSENVTVANRSMENIGILPPEQYIPAFLGIDNGKTGKGIETGIGRGVNQWLIVAIMTMTTIAYISNNTWIGISAMNLVLITFWIMGEIGVGLVMAGLIYGIMAALLIRGMTMGDLESKRV